MSLINDMLRDLDNRRKHEQQGKTFTEVPIAVRGKTSPASRWWFLGSVLLGLGVIVWLFMWFSPLTAQDIFGKMVSVQDDQQVKADSARQSVGIDAAPQPSVEQQVEKLTPTSVAEDSDSLSEVEEPAAKLLGMVINESAKSAALLLSFTDLPQYRLEQGDQGDIPSKLVISFSGVQLDDTLEIPELAGKLLERISLRPQQKHLQLLVDLGVQSRVGSYELKGNKESGYVLQIDINQVAPVITSAPQKSQAQKEMAVESARRAAPKATEQVREVSLHSTQTDDTAHLSRSKNRLSPDKQAYQAGLEQMRQGRFDAAENNFATTLAINPAHVQARVQLITALQQLNKIEQAQEQMREGLVQTPRSLQLRKMYARFLLGKRHNLEAIEVLRAQPFPEVAQDLEYHALLAALLQETRQFNAAAQVYVNLLQLRPETALWWFGFAVSMDQSGDFEQARNAYRRALALPGLNADVQKYVQNRLLVL